MADKLIGIVGGVGSYAGLDLIRKVYDLSGATSDQMHLPIAMLSLPAQTPDRTAFLLGKTHTNPGIIIAEIITTLTEAGSEIIGIPCNTAHAKPIFDHILNHIPASVKIVHLIKEVGMHIKTHFPDIRKVGLLATNGTLVSNIYPEILGQYALDIISPKRDIQNKRVQAAIYDPDYGIKAFASPIKSKALDDLFLAGASLVEAGAEAVILGCSEVVLALSGRLINNCPTIDTTEVLAAALICESRGNGLIQPPKRTKP